MINSLRLTDAAIRFGGTLLNPDCEFDAVSIDSRHIADGDLFVALVGERLDGHQFLADVADRASGLVVSKSRYRFAPAAVGGRRHYSGSGPVGTIAAGRLQRNGYCGNRQHRQDLGERAG